MGTINIFVPNLENTEGVLILHAATCKKEKLTKMGHHKPDKIHPYCLNCHYPISEFDHNCSQCGQKPTDGKTTMHDLWHEFIHTKLHLDGKFFTTLRHIFVPGKLTEEFFKGHHKRYAHPVQLFLVLGGLMLVVLSKMAYKAEDGLSKQSEEQREKTARILVFQQLDSAAQTMPFYKDPTKRKEFEDFLENQFISDKNEFQDELMSNQKKESKQIADCRRAIKLINEAVKTKNYNADSLKIMNNALTYYQFYLKKNLKDSSVIEEKVKKLAIPYAKKLDISDKILEEKGEKGEKKDKKVSINFEISFNSDLAEVLEDVDTSDMTRDSLNMNASLSRKLYMPENDSVSILRLNNRSLVVVAKKDIFTLSDEDIIKKYKPEGFWTKLFFKQGIKTVKDGGTAFHAIIKNMFYIFIASLLPMALVLSLLYRRQKRFYVEHVVFLLHFNCLGFILMPLLLLNQADFTGYLALALVVALFLGLKKYYKQSWRKTIVKGILANIAYFFIGTFIFVLGVIVSLALY
ncbi:MAG: DUF3667 domain-containing protein [Saprospiraceae bacterium]|nr:DUF3667 domain-containing protein [Saprospiraceae bacterium]